MPSENIRGAVEGVFQLEQALAAVSITFQLKRYISILHVCIFK